MTQEMQWWEAEEQTDVLGESGKRYLRELYEKDEEKRTRRGLSKVILNPENNIMYVQKGAGKESTFHPIIDRNKYISAVSAGQVSQSDKNSYVFIFDEFQDEAKDFYRSQAKLVDSQGIEALAMHAGIVTSGAFPNLSTALILTSFTNLEEAKAQK